MALKVSKPGFDVLTTGIENMSFHSDIAAHSIFNIAALNKANGQSSVTYTHNLGYVPKVWVYLDDGTSLFRIPRYHNNSGNYFDYRITDTQVIISADFSSGSYNFRAIIFTRSPSI